MNQLTRYCAWCEKMKTLHDMAVDPYGDYVKFSAVADLTAKLAASLDEVATLREQLATAQAEARRLGGAIMTDLTPSHNPPKMPPHPGDTQCLNLNFLKSTQLLGLVCALEQFRFRSGCRESGHSFQKNLWLESWRGISI